MSSSTIERYYKIILINWQLTFKIFELVSLLQRRFIKNNKKYFQILAIINLGLIYQPAHVIGFGLHDLGQIAMIYTTYSTSLVTVATILLGYILGERFPYRTYAIFCFICSFLYCTTGSLLTKQSIQLRNPVFHPTTEDLHMLIASACLCFVNCIVLVADGALTVSKTEPF